MLFGLMNVPESFHIFINDTLAGFLNRYVMTYLDDIYIYSDTLDEHWAQVRSILEALLEVELYLKPEKCVFHKEEVVFVVLVIGREGEKMDPDKIAAVQE